MAEVQRGACGGCGGLYALKKDGMVRHHIDPRTGSWMRSTRGHYGDARTCSGVGQPPRATLTQVLMGEESP